MAHGGKRQGAGRKPGSVTKRTREIAHAAIEQGLSPLEYLLSIVRDSAADEARRIDAAKAAAPYVHPRLQPIDNQGDTKQTVEIKGSLAWHPPE